MKNTSSAIPLPQLVIQMMMIIIIAYTCTIFLLLSISSPFLVKMNHSKQFS